MSVQVINDPYADGGGIARGLGQGLQDLLGRLIYKQKMGPVMQQMGLNPSMANAGPENLKMLLPHLLRSMGRKKQNQFNLQRDLSKQKVKTDAKSKASEKTRLGNVRGLMGIGYERQEAEELSWLPIPVLTAAFRSRGFIPGGGRIADSEKAIDRAFQKGKILTRPIVDAFIKKAGGNARRAKAMARKAGYKV